MKRFLLLLSISLMAMVGCEKKNEFTPVTEYYFDVPLSSKGGLPETISKATGRFKGVYYSNQRRLSYTIEYEGMTPNGFGFYKGPNDAAGVVAISPATTAFVTPYQGLTAELNTTQIAELLTGQWYVAIRSALYTNGEIRGQLTSTHN